MLFKMLLILKRLRSGIWTSDKEKNIFKTPLGFLTDISELLLLAERPVNQIILRASFYFES